MANALVNTSTGTLATDPASLERRLDSLEAVAASLQVNDEQLAARVRYLEKLIDTRDTRWWKRLWFRIDGWPPWYRVGPRKPRPWH